HGAVFVRGDRYWTDVDQPGDVVGTVGASYSPSAAMGRDYRDLRVTASYLVRRNQEGDVGHLVKLQGQFVF
ncbi:hypothetical protein, partial [Rubrivirga sp.]|uniref:hypothetical protein n=1 Tax=Rubrivirga sp. TaxID=1885344 RepID=UPI003C73BD66